MSSTPALLELYWTIGEAILDRQASEGWGARVVTRLAGDLRAEFPDMRGFSPRNLHCMAPPRPRGPAQLRSSLLREGAKWTLVINAWNAEKLSRFVRG